MGHQIALIVASSVAANYPGQGWRHPSQGNTTLNHSYWIAMLWRTS